MTLLMLAKDDCHLMVLAEGITVIVHKVFKMNQRFGLYPVVHSEK